MKTVYFKNIDFLRFLFAIFIVVFHMSRIACEQVNYLPKLNDILINSHYLNCCVEFFFIISGFFLILTFRSKQTFYEYMIQKFIRLTPVILFTVLCFAVLSFFNISEFDIMDNIYALVFLNGLGIFNRVDSPFFEYGNVHVTWFVSVFVWISVLYWYLFGLLSLKAFNIVVGCMVVVCLHIYSYKLNVLIPETIIRGIFAIGLGCLLGCFYKNYINKLKQKQISIKKIFLLGLPELILFTYFIVAINVKKFFLPSATDYIFIFIFIFALFILKLGFFSRLLENDLSVLLGRYSYSIFITHCILLDLFKKYIFNKQLINNLTTAQTIATFYTTVFFCIFFGILTYYLIEKPSSKYLSKFLLKEQNNENSKT